LSCIGPFLQGRVLVRSTIAIPPEKVKQARGRVANPPVPYGAHGAEVRKTQGSAETP